MTLLECDGHTTHKQTLLRVITVVDTWRLRVDSFRKGIDCEDILTLDKESQSLDIDLVCPFAWNGISELS